MFKFFDLYNKFFIFTIESYKNLQISTGRRGELNGDHLFHTIQNFLSLI